MTDIPTSDPDLIRFRKQLKNRDMKIIQPNTQAPILFPKVIAEKLHEYDHKGERGIYDEW